jgi:hypothetical protein
MSLKNELCDMKMNDDDSITSYFVRISQLRDRLQAIEEIISKEELVNIVLNGLPKTWDAFAASMNTRKEYSTFEELWTCCAQEESRISAKEKSQKEYDDQAFTTKFENFRNKRKFGLRKKPNQEKDMSKIQCFNCRKYGHYRNHSPELKKRKETEEATIAEEGNPQRKPSRIKQTSSSSQGNDILHSSCTYHVYIVPVHIMHIYFLEEKMVSETITMEE